MTEQANTRHGGDQPVPADAATCSQPGRPGTAGLSAAATANGVAKTTASTAASATASATASTIASTVASTAAGSAVAVLDDRDRTTTTPWTPDRAGTCVHCSSWDWIPAGDGAPPDDLHYPEDLDALDALDGPRFVSEQDQWDAELDDLLGRNRYSRVDDREWEEWHGVDQDEAERALLRREAPAWVFLPPGGDLAAAVEDTRPRTMSPIALIELMKAATRLSSWVEAVKAEAMASFYRQRHTDHATSPRPPQLDGSGRPIDPERSWHAEIALALGLSPQTVARRVTTALRLTGPLSATHTALKCGALTHGKALAICEATTDLPDQATRAVEAHVLKRATTQTHANLLRSLRTQVAKHRTTQDTTNHRAAVADRTCKIIPLPNGMAGLWIVHTADKIQQIWVTIQALTTLAKRHTPTAPADPAPTDTPRTATTPAATSRSDTTPTDTTPTDTASTDPTGGGSRPANPTPAQASRGDTAPTDTSAGTATRGDTTPTGYTRPADTTPARTSRADTTRTDTTPTSTPRGDTATANTATSGSHGDTTRTDTSASTTMRGDTTPTGYTRPADTTPAATSRAQTNRTDPAPASAGTTGGGSRPANTTPAGASRADTTPTATPHGDTAPTGTSSAGARPADRPPSAPDAGPATTAPDARPDPGNTDTTPTDTLATGAAKATDAIGKDTETVSADRPAGGAVKDTRTAEQRRADVTADLFEHILHNGLNWLGHRLPDQHRRRPHIEVTIPATTLLGLDNNPAELTGYGPIPAELARRIASNGTWRRLLTDPINGTVLEASTTRHNPGALVTETLLARHPTCTWPGCQQPSRDCDRDHTTPFAQTGTTNLTGLAPYCEYHHVIKDTPAWGWTTTSHPDGSITLTTPTGHRHTTIPPARGPITLQADRDPKTGPPLQARSTSPAVAEPLEEVRRQPTLDGRTPADDRPPF